MADNFEYLRFKNSDAKSHDSLMRQAFGTSPERNKQIREKTGTENIRVVKMNRGTVGCLTHIKCGHFIGGKPVPATFVAGVAVANEMRKKGIATYMMKELMNECMNSGIPLITLGAATLYFYRKLGFDIAGSRIFYNANLGNIRTTKTKSPDINIIKLELEDKINLPFSKKSNWSKIETIYNKFAETNNGLIDRTKYFWNEKFKHENKIIDTYLIVNGYENIGYVALHHSKSDKLYITDWCVLNTDAAKALLSFISRYSTNWKTVEWFGAPHDNLIYNMPEWNFSIAKWEDWLIRVVDAEKALAMRSYPSLLNLTLGIRINDNIIERNNCDFVLNIKKGSAMVTKSKFNNIPYIEIDIASFASLYTSHLSIDFLLNNHKVIASNESAIENAKLLFSGNPPYMLDIF